MCCCKHPREDLTLNSWRWAWVFDLLLTLFFSVFKKPCNICLRRNTFQGCVHSTQHDQKRNCFIVRFQTSSPWRGKYTNWTRVLGGTSVQHCINAISLAENNYCSMLERLAELSRDLRKSLIYYFRWWWPTYLPERSCRRIQMVYYIDLVGVSKPVPESMIQLQPHVRTDKTKNKSVGRPNGYELSCNGGNPVILTYLQTMFWSNYIR